MTREQAIRELRKLYGTRAYIRVGNEVSSPEKRAAAGEERDRHKAEEESIAAEIRRLEELHGITDLRRKMRQARVSKESAGWRSTRTGGCKFTVGENVGYAVHIKGEGDTWEEAIEMAKSAITKEKSERDARRVAALTESGR